MTITVRRWASALDELLAQGDRPLDRPLRIAIAAAVVANPYSGRYSASLDQLVEAGAWLGEELANRAVALLGDEVSSYGKAGIAGSGGELEHVAAVLHPSFGAPVRRITGGVSILPSAKKRGLPGARIDIPLHHKKAMLVRSHFSAVEFGVVDAPAADELMIAFCVTNGGRPDPRIGGLAEAEAIGEDGLR